MRSSQIISGSSAIAAAERGGKQHPIEGVPLLRIFDLTGVTASETEITASVAPEDGQGLILLSFLASAPAAYTLRLGGTDFLSFTGRFQSFGPNLLLSPVNTLTLVHESATPIAHIQIVCQECLISARNTILGG